jgi:hypothetical protein
MTGSPMTTEIDDTITLSHRIDTGPRSPNVDRSFAKFNTICLRPIREAWRKYGCTSRVVRDDASFTVEVTGPANRVLDAMAWMREGGRAWEVVTTANRVTERMIDQVNACVERGDLAFLCEHDHVTAITTNGNPMAGAYLLRPPACSTCGKESRSAGEVLREMQSILKSRRVAG